MKKIYYNLLFFLLLVAFGLGVAFAIDFYNNYKQQQLFEAISAQNEIFDEQKLIAMAQNLAQHPYVAPQNNLPASLKNLNYDQYRDIRFIRENGPWFGKKLPFEIQFFHPGSLFQNSVTVNEIIHQKSHEIKYDAAYFDFGKNTIDTSGFNALGYAGFRIHYPLNSKTYYDELISFLGASYFRALAQNQKYGISARGLAVDTALASGEEFPIFREFWLKKPNRKDKSITIYALLDSPRITGAFTFVVTPGKNTIIDTNATLFAREKITKLGIAPLTSMYLFGENTKNRFDDHRPEVHDSDGLLVLNGNNEWIWRPLDNAKTLRISAFVDNNPKGFGLLQRDRNPAHYLDFEAFYEQRPSVWVEPLENWGKGWVELVEIPSIQEIHDNVVAYWVPETPVKPLEPMNFKYRLYWFNTLPVNKIPGDITATYTGIGGVSGMLQTQQRKFVIDFDILNMQSEVKKGIATLEVSASQGKIVGQYLTYNPVTKGLTAYIDFEPNGQTSELKAVVKKNGKQISEIWSYQWLP